VGLSFLSNWRLSTSFEYLLLCVCYDSGHIFGVKASAIPVTPDSRDKQVKGVHVRSLLPALNKDDGDPVVCAFPITASNSSSSSSSGSDLLIGTRRGYVKKVATSALDTLNARGLQLISVGKQDSVASVLQVPRVASSIPSTSSPSTVHGAPSKLLVATRFGLGRVVDVEDLPSSSRGTAGKRCIQLAADDYVVGMEVFNTEPPGQPSASGESAASNATEDHALFITSEGTGKLTSADDVVGNKLFADSRRGKVLMKVFSSSPFSLKRKSGKQKETPANGYLSCVGKGRVADDDEVRTQNIS
jgi:DNA gyrase/topoisomerase IV subunit A